MTATLLKEDEMSNSQEKITYRAAGGGY